MFVVDAVPSRYDWTSQSDLLPDDKGNASRVMADPEHIGSSVVENATGIRRSGRRRRASR